MPQFIQETIQGPVYPSSILSGDGHYFADRPIDENQTLALGQLLGMSTATGRWAALDETVHTVALSGDGAATAFDLDHDSVDPDTILAFVAGGLDPLVTVSAGTGTDGVDQVVFESPPANGAAISVRYQRSVARVAGVLFCNGVVTGAGEYPTFPVVQTGAVLREKLVGLPPRYNVPGRMIGGLIIEDGVE
jgi:hypothetical protein